MAVPTPYPCPVTRIPKLKKKKKKKRTVVRHYVQEYIQEELCVGGCPRAFDFVNITGNAFNTN